MHDLTKAADLGVPSLVWRAGQVRRFEMIRTAAGPRLQGAVLDNGCGIGLYVAKLRESGGKVIGLEYDQEQAIEAREHSDLVLRGAGEHLPFPDHSFDLMLSHEVIEHVQDDRNAIEEMVRTLKKGGRLVVFCPNRGYPFETHGIYLRGEYRFGNKLFVNYLPRKWRDRLAPHVRVYTRTDMKRLFSGLPVQVVTSTVIFGAYDNIIYRFPAAGRFLRSFLQTLEKTPLRVLGLSHYWVVEKQ